MPRAVRLKELQSSFIGKRRYGEALARARAIELEFGPQEGAPHQARRTAGGGASSRAGSPAHRRTLGRSRAWRAGHRRRDRLLDHTRLRPRRRSSNRAARHREQGAEHQPRTSGRPDAQQSRRHRMAAPRRQHVARSRAGQRQNPTEAGAATRCDRSSGRHASAVSGVHRARDVRPTGRASSLPRVADLALHPAPARDPGRGQSTELCPRLPRSFGIFRPRGSSPSPGRACPTPGTPASFARPATSSSAPTMT